MAGDEMFFDKDDVLENYLKGRKRPDNPNDALERPLFLELLGELSHLDIIDLGCGDGLFGLEAMNNGAAPFVGIEGSQAMVEIAHKVLADTEVKVHCMPIEDWRGDDGQVDVVTARLSMNYVEDLPLVFGEAYKALRPGGRLIVSV